MKDSIQVIWKHGKLLALVVWQKSYFRSKLLNSLWRIIYFVSKISYVDLQLTLLIITLLRPFAHVLCVLTALHILVMLGRDPVLHSNYCCVRKSNVKAWTKIWRVSFYRLMDDEWCFRWNLYSAAYIVVAWYLHILQSYYDFFPSHAQFKNHKQHHSWY